MKRSLFSRFTVIALSVVLLALSGCATLRDARMDPGTRLDPWENWNRKVFAFNEGLDEFILKPVATGYSKVVPQFVRRSVENFFNNAADAWSAVNNLLQGKGQPAMEDVIRVSTNTVFGVLGLVDIATELGLEHHYEDFGQTLGRWGFGAGAYIVWPLFGPSTVRDSIALPLDRYASPALVINDGRTQVGITAMQIISTRAKLLGATQVIDDIALDKYAFIRDAYLQRRRSLVNDGDSPDNSATYAPYVPDPAGSSSAGAASAPAASASSPAASASAPAESAAPLPAAPASAASAP